MIFMLSAAGMISGMNWESRPRSCSTWQEAILVCQPCQLCLWHLKFSFVRLSSIAFEAAEAAEAAEDEDILFLLHLLRNQIGLRSQETLSKILWE
jgi:hypothetical protein